MIFLHNHIDKLFEQAEPIHEDNDILEAAKMRKAKNNPPGKSTDPIGDEISWELILRDCTDEDIVIISHDLDWKYAEEGRVILHPFLQEEWNGTKTKAKVNLFSSLAAFIESIAPKKITKEDVDAEKKIGLPLTYTVKVVDGTRVNDGAVLVTPPSVFVGTPSISTWQPVNVSGTTLVSLPICKSCRSVVPVNYLHSAFGDNNICPYCSAPMS